MPKRILVVEDEFRVQAVIKKRLESAGYQVLTAADGKEGLDLAREAKPDLIVLDLMLPKMDGYAVCRELRHDPEHEHIPILMLTARAQEGDIQRGMMTGADAYMTKPFQHSMLLDRIQEMLDKAEREAVQRAENQPPWTRES
jgi:DNA-binding response OmpR family regulator